MKVYAFILALKSGQFRSIEDKHSFITLYGYMCTPHVAIRVWSVFI